MFPTSIHDTARQGIIFGAAIKITSRTPRLATEKGDTLIISLGLTEEVKQAEIRKQIKVFGNHGRLYFALIEHSFRESPSSTLMRLRYLRYIMVYQSAQQR